MRKCVRHVPEGQPMLSPVQTGEGEKVGLACLFQLSERKAKARREPPPRARHRAARLSTAYGEGGARRSFRSPADHPNSYQVQIYHCLSRMHPMRFLHVMEASPQT